MRQPSIGRRIALLTGATVVLLLTIDTTMACRFFMRHHYWAPCPPMPRCWVSTPCEVVVYHHAAPIGCAPVEDACCGEVEVQEGVQAHVQETPTEAKAADAPPVKSDRLPSPAKPEVDTVDNVTELPPETAEPAPLPDGLEESTTDLAEPPATDVEEPTIVEPTPADASVTPLPPDDNLDSLFDETPSATAPDTALPAAEAPAAEPPAAEPPAAEPPADTGADNLFDEPAADLPADDAGADDLFSEPPGGEAPADDAADDLFSEPPATEETPADGAGSDDLFNTPPVDEMPADDLDLVPSAPADSATDLPGFEEAPPADQPSDAAPSDQPDATDRIDDLFNSNSSVEPAADAPATVATPAATSTSAESVTRQAEALPPRLWVDNTGLYRTQGRLVNVTPTHVRLLKDNGHFTTVDKRRLSPADVHYVEQITQQLGVEYFDQLARR